MFKKSSSLKNYYECVYSRVIYFMLLICLWLQDDRFKAHDGITNRRLLWHGTNVAVVAAILKSGLRIMPHSGGRVGKGIYLASENGKSASYGKSTKLPERGPYFIYLLLL